MSRPLYLIVPHLKRPSGPTFDAVKRVSGPAGTMGFEVTVYAGMSFAETGAQPELTVVPYFTEPDRPAGWSDAGPASRPGRHWPLMSQLVRLARSTHLRDSVRALFKLSFSPRSIVFWTEAYNALYCALKAIRSIWRAALSIPSLVFGLPRAVKNLFIGPPVSVEPFSPLAAQLAALLDETAAEGLAVVVILSDDPSDLDAVMDIELLARSGPAAVKMIFLAEDWEGVNLDPRIDPAMLGARLAASALAPRLDIFVDAPDGRNRLARLLGRDVWPFLRLEDDLAAAAVEPRSTDSTARPVAVIIRPDWLYCGSNMVFANQIGYFTERGYYVLEIAVNGLFLGGSTPERLTDDFLTANRGSMASRTVMLNLKVGLLPWLRVLRRYGRGLFRSSLSMHAGRRALAEAPESLARALARRRADIVVVNHCFNMLVARQLFPDSPLILESHDIQAEQSRIQHTLAGRTPDQFDIDAARADELDLMRDASWVVSLNEDETRYFAESGKFVGVTTIHPYLADPAGHRFKGLDGPNTAPTANPIVAPGPIDVLLVSSHHAANVVSMRWFLDNVFKTILGHYSVRVTVVGTISDAVSATHPNLNFTGRVRDIRPFYEAAKVVALPVTAGAGIPIKTLEALTLGKAVVATSGALRGLSNGSAHALPTFDDAADFAMEIVRLITDSTGREERARAGRSVAEAAYSRSAYFQGWDSVIEHLPTPDRDAFPI